MILYGRNPFKHDKPAGLAIAHYGIVLGTGFVEAGWAVSDYPPIASWPTAIPGFEWNSLDDTEAQRSVNVAGMAGLTPIGMRKTPKPRSTCKRAAMSGMFRFALVPCGVETPTGLVVPGGFRLTAWAHARFKTDGNVMVIVCFLTGLAGRESVLSSPIISVGKRKR